MQQTQSIRFWLADFVSEEAWSLLVDFLFRFAYKKPHSLDPHSRRRLRRASPVLCSSPFTSWQMQKTQSIRFGFSILRE